MHIKVKVGNDQEKAQSERDSLSKIDRDRKMQTDCKQSLHTVNTAKLVELYDI